MSGQILSMIESGLVLITVLALVIIRPRGLNGAWPAGIGAIIVIILGLVSLPTLIVIFNTTWDAAFTLIALFLLSEALDSNGFFTWAALYLARYAKGSGWRLYVMILLLTTGVTALLANDGAVLMLTPILAQLLLRIYPESRYQLPFVFAAGFFADAMSAIFVPSNLTNIIIAGASHLSFAQVALWMFLPTLTAFIVGGTAFALRFRKQLRTRYEYQKLGNPGETIRDTIVFWLSWVALALLIIGYIIGGELRLPVSLIAVPIALLMVILVQVRGIRSIGSMVQTAPWSILIYALAMFVVITGAYNAQILNLLIQPLRTFVAAGASPGNSLLAGGVLAVLSAGVNNLPATLIGVLVLRSVNTAGVVNLLATYAIILGVDIGPKLTPFGSLATLLWLRSLQHNQIHISWRKYMLENFWVTLLVLGAAFAGLFVSYLLLK